MNKLIFFLLIHFPVLLFGQDLRKVKDRSSNETFFVLESDGSTRHGEYKKFGYHDRLLLKGYYRQGIKDSIWEAYGPDGQLALQYDFTHAELLYYQLPEGRKYKVVNIDEHTDTVLSRPPLYLGGDAYIMSELAKNTRYPQEAMENGTSGVVPVRFTVDRYGKTSNHHVETLLGHGLDEEAIRVLKLIPDNWLPGLVAGRPVDVEVIYPITFRMQ